MEPKRTLRNVIIGRLSRGRSGNWLVISATEISSDNFTTDQRGWASATYVRICQPADITALSCWVVAISGRLRYNDDDDTMAHCLCDASLDRQAGGRRQALTSWPAPMNGERCSREAGTDRAALTVPAALPTVCAARPLVNRFNTELPGLSPSEHCPPR